MEKTSSKIISSSVNKKSIYPVCCDKKQQLSAYYSEANSHWVQN